MTEEKDKEKEKKETSVPQRDLDAILKAHTITASKELAALLDTYGLQLNVAHVIQLVPKRRT